MGMFEQIPPWALQQAAQQQGQQQPMNKAPMIMSPYQHGQSMPYQPPQPQQPQQDPSGMNGGSSQPIGMGQQMQSLFGNPQAQAANSNNPMAGSQGAGGLMQLLAAIHNGRQGQNAPQLSPDQLAAMGITPSQMTGQYQPQPQFTGDPRIDSQQQAPASPSGGGGFADWLKGMFR